jgi:CHASE3 domain sensor protein
MGGSIDLLKQAYDQLSSFSTKDNISQESLDKRLAPIESQLATIKTVIDQYEEQKKFIDSLVPLLKDNAPYLMASIASQGKLQVIESGNASILKRLEKLEDNKNINWNRITTITAIVIAIFGLFSTCLSVIVALYVGFK